MPMIITVDSENRATLSPLVEAMLEARKQVFVDLLGWELNVRQGRFETDEFDNEHARYLIVADAENRHLGSARILPTTRPHILGTLFPQLCADAPPQGTRIFEITRFCLGRNLGAVRRREIRNSLVRALVDHALTGKIVAYTGVAEQAWLRQILAFGWQCRLLGDLQSIGGMTLGALRIDISKDTPRLLSEAGIVRSAAAETTQEAA
jgi:acyl-homoserine lactone synthase